MCFCPPPGSTYKPGLFYVLSTPTPQTPCLAFTQQIHDANPYTICDCSFFLPFHSLPIFLLIYSFSSLICFVPKRYCLAYYRALHTRNIAKFWLKPTELLCLTRSPLKLCCLVVLSTCSSRLCA